MSTVTMPRPLTEDEFSLALDDVLYASHRARIGGPAVGTDPAAAAAFDRVVAKALTDGLDLGDGYRWRPLPEDQETIRAAAFEQVEHGEPYDEGEED
jgi:hypothetical protein